MKNFAGAVLISMSSILVSSGFAGDTQDAQCPTGMAWDVDVALKHAPSGPADLWPAQQSVAATQKGPQADTSAYVDTTDDGKGKVMASDEGFPGEGPSNAFNNNQEKWCVNKTAAWIQYQYADNARRKVTAYSITSGNDAPGRDPRDWRLLGSNDGQTWTEVDARKDEDFSQRWEKRLFVAKAPGEYNGYRLDIQKNHGDVSTQIAEMELLAGK